MSVDVVVDPSLYPLEAIQAAAYVFVDRCFVLLDRAPDGRVKVTLEPRTPELDGALRTAAGEFQNELLAQVLRLELARRHEKVREALVARALFGAAPAVDPPAPTDEELGVEARFVPAGDDDYLDDPLGIAVPWEEKYGEGKAGAPAKAADDPPAAPPAPGGSR